VKIGDLVQSGNLRDRYGIILSMKESTRTGLSCNSELRYECHVKWFNTGRPDLDGYPSSWWGAWSLKVISASR
jgi:hypothetical protein